MKKRGVLLTLLLVFTLAGFALAAGGGENDPLVSLSYLQSVFLSKAESAAQEKLGAFHDAFMRWWMSENRPQGFDVQDIRMGGLMMRLQTCRERLLAWCGGMLENIPELEEEELGVDCGTNWMQTAITGVISHNVM